MWIIDRWFICFCGLWLAGTAIGLAAEGGRIGLVGALVSAVLLIGLARRMWVTWALLLIASLFGAISPWIVHSGGFSPGLADLAFVAVRLAQAWLLLSFLRPDFRRRAGTA